jgi:hypothetical protein
VRIEPEVGAVSVVLLGNFNPAIFTPAWFAKWSLLSENEVAEAKIEVVHPEITAFTAGTKRITVQADRFTVESSEAPWITLADLVEKTFQEFLPHTPASKLGINRIVHFGVGTEECRNSIGRKLAPTEPWGEWGQRIENSPPALRGGFTSLTMQEAWETEEFRGHIQTLVEPSKKVTGNSGIYMRVNHHSEVISPKPEVGCEKIIGYLRDNFQTSIEKAEWIIDQVMRLKVEQ